MAIVAVQQPEKNNYDPLEQIGKALGIAQSIYGIKTAYEQGALRDIQMQREQQGLEKDKLVTQNEQSKYNLAKAGTLSPKEFNSEFDEANDIQGFIDKYGKDYPISKIKVKVLDPETNEPREVIAVRKENLKEAADHYRGLLSIQGQNASRLLTSEKSDAAVIKADEKTKAAEEKATQSRLVPGLGEAYTVQDAKDLKEAIETKRDLDDLANRMIELRKKYGAETLNREAVAIGQSLSKQALLKYKTLAKLGVLSQADMEIVEKIFPSDPLGVSIQDVTFGLAPGGDPIMAQLEQVKASVDSAFQSSISARLMKREQKDPAFTAAENELAEYLKKNQKTQ